jgi:4-amino-4-deoxy-L-arabinose transferase-like glycosyltransferase
MLSPARTAAAVATEPPPARTTRVSVEAWLVVGLVILGAVLRFATISSQSYWFDEAQAAHEMHLSFGALMSTIGAQETSPPLYFTLAWLWAKVFGTGEAGLRSLSAIAGVAVIPLCYLSGRELVSRRAGLAAAALAAISPFMIYYSQEAREYMLTAALCGASFLFFARALRAPSSRNLAWWAVWSALALLTHFYAGFLVAPEGAWLLYSGRRRATVAACAAVVAVEAALAPLAISDTSHPIGWITAFPLSTRVEQVPVAFGLGTLSQSSLVNYGLLGAAALACALIVLLVVGAESDQLRGAGAAAAITAFVLLVPLLLALAGHDYYIARALIPAWIPLAVLVGAACAVPRARIGGALLGVVLLVAFVLASIRISDHAQYQRPDWRGVAAALGPAVRSRAVLVYPGSLGAGPVSLYLRGVPWAGNAATAPATNAPVTVSELDVIGNTSQTPVPTPPGMRLVSRSSVAGYLVERYALSSPWRLAPVDVPQLAGSLLTPASPAPVVLIQPRR